MKNRRNSESLEQRDVRLDALRKNQTTRLANESFEDKEVRLDILRKNQTTRLANESFEDKEVRLDILRKNQSTRLANESSKDKEVRLNILRKNQTTRLANESFEERIHRLCLYSDNRDNLRRIGHNSPDPDSEQPGPAFPNPSSALESCKLGMICDRELTKLYYVIWRMFCVHVGISFPLEFYSFVLSGENNQPPRKRLCSNNGDAVPSVVEDDTSDSEDDTIINCVQPRTNVLG